MDLTIPCGNTSDSDAPTPPPVEMAHLNGSLKRQAPVVQPQPQPQPPPPPSLMVVGYKECLKNHAAGIGGYALDGCGEFMPSPTFDSSNPTSLKCAACGCHRNFHRRQAKDSHPNSLNLLQPSPKPATAVPPSQPHAPPQAPPQRGFPSPSSSTSPSGSPTRCSIPSPETSPSPPPVTHFSAPANHASAPQILLSLGNSYGTAPAEEQQGRSLIQQREVKPGNPSGRKRSRTKFSREQKEKMYMFCEKLGWKMQRADDREVQEFCDEVDVSRYVFKVWMHNNKNKRSDLHTSRDRDIGADSSGRDDLNSYNFNGSNNDIDQLKHEGSYGNAQASANGSSPKNQISDD